MVVADQHRESAEETAAAVRDAGGRAEACELNAVDEQAVAKAFDGGLQRLGRFDILVNTTCWSTGKSLDQMSLAEWEAGTRVSLGGAFVLAREAGRLMADQQRGSIIQFGSMYGVVSPDPRVYEGRLPVNPPDYGAAKAGVLQLVRYQAVMLGPRGVRVNAVVPGPFPNSAKYVDNQWFGIPRLSERVPMGRVGRAEEIVGAVVYLASDAASYVTGTSLVVDGGWTAW